MRKILLALLLAAALPGAAFAAHPVHTAKAKAKPADADAPPSPDANPVLANIEKSGAKLYPLGLRDGLQGWFIIKDGQVQIAYGTPDNQSVLVGALFGPDGENVTTLQVANLMRNNKEVADLIANAQKEQAAIAAAGSAPAEAAAAPAKGIPSEPLSPGEQLMRDLGTAAAVEAGTNANAPEIDMVMDPHCPHCQATWKALRGAVLGGKLRIRMVPIGTQGDDDERAAAVLLGVANPTQVWDGYVAGNRALLAGTPPASALQAVRDNHALVDKWHIDVTPYIVWRGKNGQIEVMRGEPDKVASLLSDLGI